MLTIFDFVWFAFNLQPCVFVGVLLPFAAAVPNVETPQMLLERAAAGGRAQRAAARAWPVCSHAQHAAGHLPRMFACFSAWGCIPLVSFCCTSINPHSNSSVCKAKEHFKLKALFQIQ